MLYLRLESVESKSKERSLVPRGQRYREKRAAESAEDNARREMERHWSPIEALASYNN